MRCAPRAGLQCEVQVGRPCAGRSVTWLTTQLLLSEASGCVLFHQSVWCAAAAHPETAATASSGNGVTAHAPQSGDGTCSSAAIDCSNTAADCSTAAKECQPGRQLPISPRLPARISLQAAYEASRRHVTLKLECDTASETRVSAMLRAICETMHQDGASFCGRAIAHQAI